MRWNAAWLVVGCVVWAMSAHAEIYKWVDADGQVHYGQRPAGSGAREMQIEQPETPPPAAGPTMEERRAKQQRLLDSFRRQREQEKSDKAAEQKRKAEQHANCLDAKDNLKNYRRARYLYRLGENGQRVPLTDAERAAGTRKLEQQVEKLCR